MQNEKELFPRRHFLKWSAASVAAAARPDLLRANCVAQEASASSAAERTPSAHLIMLRSAEMEVAIDPQNGLPWEYRLLKNNARLRGED
ncbi:MAG TPA: twin-arginine translocation signal domain-containing protein, partial [Acidobacteriaceae bacterium]|nr:twin-arginine translocation signal domain-containing protein [Acidobacteriaceae bacterium]